MADTTTKTGKPAAADLDTRYDAKEIEPRWYARWIEGGTFTAKTGADAGGRPPFCIVIPPPNVTGVLHMGHALNNTIQDILSRWRRMEGRNVLWLPGTDHAGIATQNVVERMLKKEKKTRHDLGREAFVSRVWEWKEKHGGFIIQQLKRLGCSCDWSRERFTMDEGLSRAVREVFVRLFREGLVYRGERLVNWCVRCATALSDEEAEPRQKEGGLWFIRYPVKGEAGRHVTVATTRPETMLGDTGVAVNPDDPRYRDLIGKRCTLPLIGRELPLVGDAAVDPKFGTGALKVTPAHDPVDFEIGARHGLERVNVMTPTGKINENGGPFAGLDRFEARDRVIAALSERGVLEKHEKHVHNVPFCQRCETIVEPLLSKQWFVRMKPLAEKALAAQDRGEVRFHPERWEGVYRNWLNGIRDWCISRQLWWGHRIPVWYCEACGKEHAEQAAPARCAACGATALRQDEDVLDTWFSSWLWPFSTLGWPDDTPDMRTFYTKGHGTDVLVTAPDIIFFWVARMIMAGLHFTGRVPFSDVYFNGVVTDEKGEKMSKSKGNALDPLVLIDKFSADALRFSLVMLTSEGQDCRISEGKIEQGRNFATKLWNAARLVLSKLDDFHSPMYPFRREPSEHAVPRAATAKPRLEDQWIKSRLARTVESTRRSFEAFRFNEALVRLYDFFWGQFCAWYLEIVKPRLYGAPSPDRECAQATAAAVLETCLRLLHPYVPHITEEVWQRLKGIIREAGWPESISIAPFPTAATGDIAPEAEQEQEQIIAIVTEVRNIRNRLSVPPQKKLRLLLTADADAALAVPRAHGDAIRALEELEELQVAERLAKPAGSAAAVAGAIRIYVPLEGLIDLAKERARMKDRIDKKDQAAQAARAKLANPDFAARAKPDVVARERERLAALDAELDALRREMADLG